MKAPQELLPVGPYLVTFDEAGASIEQTATHEKYRVSAATATNAIDFVQYHKRLMFAMTGRLPEAFEPYRVVEEYSSLSPVSERDISRGERAPAQKGSPVP